MGIDELARQFAALPPAERALFAAMVRAHEVFNIHTWRAEIASRHRAVDAGKAVRVALATEALTGKAASNPPAGEA